MTSKPLQKTYTHELVPENGDAQAFRMVRDDETVHNCKLAHTRRSPLCKTMFTLADCPGVSTETPFRMLEMRG